MPLVPNMLLRDNAEFFNAAKSYARREEALKLLSNCADLLSASDNVLDYMIWQTPTGRYVPIWFMAEKHSIYALQASDFGVVSFRR